MADAIERERGIIVVLAVPKRRKIVRNFFFPKSIEYLDKKNKNITVSRKNINCLLSPFPDWLGQTIHLLNV